MTRQIIKNIISDEERALYNTQNAKILNCTFVGEKDGESALKESRDIQIKNTHFCLRYPLWHVQKFSVETSIFTDTCRAPIWYSTSGKIVNTEISGVKAVRECKNIKIQDCKINSTEFGWKSSNIKMQTTNIISEYLFFDSKNITLENVEMKGKYSFQYVKNLKITDSYLDTKDAFWHIKNATIQNCVIKGEYLGWYSENLTFINCKIIGTQPLCYCKNLKLINCTMENCDLSFEYSDLQADIIGHIDSVKNPISGTITADSYGEIILNNSVYDCKAKITTR